MSFVGIDIGSSQVKAVAFAECGKVLASFKQPYSFTVSSDGAMELDGNTVMSAAFEVLKACSNAVKAVSPVQAIGCSSQGEAFSMLDDAGNILAPAMISGDIRPAAVIEEFFADYGKDKLYRQTGQPGSAMFSIAKLLYIKKYHPELFARCAKILCFEDLLAYKLTGKAVMGASLANRTMLYDPVNACWIKELLELCGIQENMLAEVMPSGKIGGTLTPAVAKALDMSENVCVVTGGHDQIMGAFGCGAVKPAMAMYAAGSVQALVPVMDKFVLSDELLAGNLCTSNSAVENMYASIAYSLTGSNLTEYFIREIVRDGARDYDALYNDMPAAPSNLLVLPYFTASGTPYFDARTPGCIYGWRFGTTRGELFKALSEGVAMEMRLNCELLKQNGFELKQLIASGGGFRNSRAVQLHADVLNLPISLCNEAETGCRGAASLAAQAITTQALPVPEITLTVEPDQSRSNIYSEKYMQWKNFSQTIRNFN